MGILTAVFGGFENKFAHDHGLWIYIIILKFTDQKSSTPVINSIYELFLWKYTLIHVSVSLSLQIQIAPYIYVIRPLLFIYIFSLVLERSPEL